MTENGPGTIKLTKIKINILWLHEHALHVRVDLKGPIAALDGMKSEANVVSRTCTECSR
jgi:hypothetical protein